MPPLEDTEGFTELALGPDIGQQQQGQMPNKHGLYVEFYLEAIPDPAKTLEAGHPKFKEVPFVMIMVPGDKTSVIRRPVRTGQHPKHDNNRFHNEYVAFMQKKDAPVDGYPLDQWAALTKSQVLELQHFGFKTVEHLAGITDTNAQKGMGLITLRDKARVFIEASKEGAPLLRMHEELKTRDDLIAALQMQMEEMKAELGDMKKPKRSHKKME